MLIHLNFKGMVRLYRDHSSSSCLQGSHPRSERLFPGRDCTQWEDLQTKLPEHIPQLPQICAAKGADPTGACFHGATCGAPTSSQSGGSQDQVPYDFLEELGYLPPGQSPPFCSWRVFTQ